MSKKMIAACVLACGFAFTASAFAQEAPVSYTLMIGTDKEAWEDEFHPKVSGVDLGGTEIVRVNGNPVAALVVGARVLTLNPMLKPGENVISFEGRIRKTLYVKLLSVRGGQVFETVARKAIRPDDAGEARELKFETKSAYTPPFYKEAAKVEDTPQAREEIWQAIDQFQKDVAAGKAVEAAARIFEGPRIWIVSCYSLAPDALAEMIKNQIEWARGIQKTLQPLAKADLKYVFGPNTVMVYAGFEDSEQKPSYSFTLKDGDDVQHVPHLIFARIGGKWMVW